jgi:hypothetical protein
MPTQLLLFTQLGAWPLGRQMEEGQITAREPLRIKTGMANYRNCQGRFTYSNCTMMPAMLGYDIVLQKQIITYIGPSASAPPLAVSNQYCHDKHDPCHSAMLGFVSLMMHPFW